MPRLRAGRNQLNVINVSDEVIKEFDGLRKGRGPGGKDVPRWELFETVWQEWKDFKISAGKGGRKKAVPKVSHAGGLLLIEPEDIEQQEKRA